MKTLFLLSLLLGCLSVSAFAQAPPPPPPAAPDYNPTFWKEYSFENDNIRFKFPVEPKPRETTTGRANSPTRLYERTRFMSFNLMVIDGPADDDTEARTQGTEELIQRLRDSGLEGIKHLDPKIIEETDIKVDGHPGRFLKVETNDGVLTRMKFFVVKNRLYFAWAGVKKGERHGFNWQNDFEIPAMGFLDSIHVIK